MYHFPDFDEYVPTFENQNFSLPNSIIYYITQNPTTSKVYQKLIQCCKYFYIKNPILVIDNLTYNDNDGWNASSCCEYSHKFLKKIQKSGKFPFNKLSSKIWITKILEIASSSMNSTLLPQFLQKLFRCDVLYLELVRQVIPLENLLLLSQNVWKCCLLETIIYNENAKEISFELFIEKLPKLQCVLCRFFPGSKFVKSDTVKNFITLLCSTDRKFEHINLQNLSETFDIDTFYKFIKKCKYTTACLFFNSPISDAYKEKLDEIIDEIINLPAFYFIPPSIHYFQMAPWKIARMQKIEETFRKIF